MLSPTECYDFRCKVLHQGKSKLEVVSYFTSIRFSEPSHNFSLQIGKIEIDGTPSVKVIDLNILVNAMLGGWKIG